MKKILILLFIIGVSVSCEYGLDELPLFEDADITYFKLETREIDVAMQKVVVIHGSSSTTSVVVDANAHTVIAVVTSEVDLTKLVGIATISRGATISPMDGAPQLGVPGDFSKPNKYEVTAADSKTIKIWTITVQK